MALYADAERGRYPVWQSFDHPDFFPGSGILFVTVTVCYCPSPKMDHLQLISIPLKPPTGGFLSQDRIPHKLSSQIRGHDYTPNEDVSTTFTFRNTRPDRFLLREVVEQSALQGIVFELACVVL